MRTSLFRLSIVVLVSATIVAGAWHLWHKSRPGIAKLAGIAAPYRTVEGRLSGFPYRPLAPRMRAARAETLTPTASLQLLAIGAEITEAAQREPSIENLHGIGVAQLL